MCCTALSLVGGCLPQAVDIATEMVKLLPQTTLDQIRAANALDTELYTYAEHLFLGRLHQYGLNHE